MAERENISRGLSAGASLRAIAAKLGRSPSTISRELRRNDGRERYRAEAAETWAWKRAARPKRCKLADLRRLQRAVALKLSEDWSPEQISGWLKQTFPGDERMNISHETIYRSLFIQARGVLKKELRRHLRSGRMTRHNKNYTREGQGRGTIANAVPISERPPEIEDRAVPGHWEGDLISGSGNSHIATLVERSSRFTLLVKVENKETQTVIAAMTKQVKKIPLALRRSLTWDRGSEMSAHQQFTIATDVKVYFCDPRSPWQRGTNENTNRLLRQYFPKGSELSQYSQSDLDRVARKLNRRPRKTLAFETPAHRFASSVALTN
jgi:IS30 family transposase